MYDQLNIHYGFRWMNKFSPASTCVKDPTTGKSNIDMDFDFGDLVTMTIINVFKTDTYGKLLLYCPTFDNRAVHKTPEMAERLRKGASHLMERMEVAARSPAGKTVNKVIFHSMIIANIAPMKAHFHIST